MRKVRAHFCSQVILIILGRYQISRMIDVSGNGEVSEGEFFGSGRRGEHVVEEGC